MGGEIAELGELAQRVLLFAALVGLLFVPLELLWPAHGARRTIGRDGGPLVLDLAFATLGQLCVRGVLALGLGSLLVGLETVGPQRPLFAGIPAGWLRSALEVAVGLLLFELAGYAYHRLAHRVPWLWRMHALHHSSPTLDWLASFRQHPLELVLMTVVQNAPLVLLGIPLASHASLLLLLKLHTVFVHANLRMPEGGWARLIALPRFHHRHHESDGDAAACNYASLFPFIDLAFGTFSERSEPGALAPKGDFAPQPQARSSSCGSGSRGDRTRC